MELSSWGEGWEQGEKRRRLLKVGSWLCFDGSERTGTVGTEVGKSLGFGYPVGLTVSVCCACCSVHRALLGQPKWVLGVRRR